MEPIKTGTAHGISLFLICLCIHELQTARKPARLQAHEAPSLVKASGCDLYVCACICMLIYVWAWACAWACLVWV